MAGAQPRNSCKSLFKQLELIRLPCQYTLSLTNFIIINHEHFPTDSSINKINTRNKHCLHKTNANRTCIQKSTVHTGINIFSNVPTNVKILKNVKAKFKVALSLYFISHSF